MTIRHVTKWFRAQHMVTSIENHSFSTFLQVDENQCFVIAPLQFLRLISVKKKPTDHLGIWVIVYALNRYTICYN